MCPIRLHDEDQIDDPPRPPAFGGKSRDEWVSEQLVAADQRQQELGRERRKERLIVWPLISLISMISLLFVGLIIMPLLDAIGDLLRGLLRGLFGSFGLIFLAVVGCALLIIAFRALSRRI
jgi:hypothetical protein